MTFEEGLEQVVKSTPIEGRKPCDLIRCFQGIGITIADNTLGSDDVEHVVELATLM